MPGLAALMRSFARRYVIAFVLTASVMVGLIVWVNYIIDAKLNSVERVDLNNTTKSSSEVLNFLLIGSDSRAFVQTPEEAQAFGNQAGNGGQHSDTLMVVHIAANRNPSEPIVTAQAMPLRL